MAHIRQSRGRAAIEQGFDPLACMASPLSQAMTMKAERVNKEIKRRTQVAGLFPNEDSLLRLVSGVVAELSDEWESSNINLNIKETDTDLPF